MYCLCVKILATSFVSGTLFLFLFECKCCVLFVGTLVLVEKDKILWSLQVDHRLFVLDKLDVTVSIIIVCLGFYGQARGHCGNRIKHVFNGKHVVFFSPRILCCSNSIVAVNP